MTAGRERAEATELDDLERVQKLEGLFVGQLTNPELEALARLVRAGMANIDYSGAAGLFALARVRMGGATE